jgi:hypothetical protein
VLELAGSGRYSLVLTAGDGRVRIPGCSGLVLDLDALWQEIDEAARQTRRKRR